MGRHSHSDMLISHFCSSHPSSLGRDSSCARVETAETMGSEGLCAGPSMYTSPYSNNPSQQESQKIPKAQPCHSLGLLPRTNPLVVRSKFPLSLSMPQLCLNRATVYSPAEKTPAQQSSRISCHHNSFSYSSETLEASHMWICFTMGTRAMEGYSQQAQRMPPRSSHLSLIKNPEQCRPRPPQRATVDNRRCHEE